MALPIMEPAMEPAIDEPKVPIRPGLAAAGAAAGGGGAIERAAGAGGGARGAAAGEERLFLANPISSKGDQGSSPAAAPR
eukprot:CAMPEP_0119066950 /NCGR_PEP_ID=MMETSP1178-20130426/9347_1 /TAXON_ID=33656 /ORGANISM="unid sp, Strain CCMP2000" /LENGTH=79 /DNA_ID=CAMNT_0007048581 /DNA_START=76 /DNA_END=311 /DNA_ORIENTATION=-